jgi:UDP-glucose:glycoprotein glucosyltransferase
VLSIGNIWQARSLVRIVVSPELRKEVKKNQESFMNSLSLQPTDSVLFLNGLFFDVDTLDAAALLEAARSELRTMEGLHSIGMGLQLVLFQIISSTA